MPRFPIRLLIAAAIAIALVAVMGWLERALERRAARGEAGISSGEGDPQVRAAFQRETPSGVALADVAGRFVDVEGRERSMASLVGEPFVLSLVYTRCRTVCPRTMAELSRLERDAAAAGAPARFVVVSLDPAHDSPDTLRAFAARQSLDLARWTLLAPEPAALATLTSALGVAMGPDAAGGVMHTAMIATVDSTGAVRSWRVGLDTSPERLLADWQEANRAERALPAQLR
jgi:cytochrome oxidase Cu insertion factor (SCO1/SenC/PrrC family)